MKDILNQAIARMRSIITIPDPGDDRLAEAARTLRCLAMGASWPRSSFRPADPGEELVYELDVASGKPSLYLVSDGVGTRSPAHRHDTWAIMAGIRGRESHAVFAFASDPGRPVVPMGVMTVGRGETLVLTADRIHATEVVGSEATFHLHLYGRPLHELPSFVTRCHAVTSGA